MIVIDVLLERAGFSNITREPVPNLPNLPNYYALEAWKPEVSSHAWCAKIRTSRNDVEVEEPLVLHWT